MILRKILLLILIIISSSSAGFSLVLSEKVFALPNPYLAIKEKAVEFILPNKYKLKIISIFNEHGKFLKTIMGRTNSSGKISYKWFGFDDEGMLAPAGLYFVLVNGKDLIKLVLYR